MSNFEALELPQPNLTDGAIILRAWNGEDADDLIAAVPQPDSELHLPVWDSIDDAKQWIERQATRLTERIGYPFAITSAEDDSVRGFIGLWLRQDGSAAVGYWILPHARRQGLATRSVKLVAAWARNDLGITDIQAAVEPGNLASIRVAESAGFEVIGPVKDYRDVAGHLYDVMLYRYAL